jgi:hypothetical protein
MRGLYRRKTRCEVVQRIFHPVCRSRALKRPGPVRGVLAGLQAFLTERLTAVDLVVGLAGQLRQVRGFVGASLAGSTREQSLDGVSGWHEPVPDFRRQRSINQDKLRAQAGLWVTVKFGSRSHALDIGSRTQRKNGHHSIE